MSESELQNAMLVDVRCVAEMLGCSTAHVRRMVKSGQMPRPVKLGSLVRWRREELDAWIENGCPDVSRPPSVHFKEDAND